LGCGEEKVAVRPRAVSKKQWCDLTFVAPGGDTHLNSLNVDSHFPKYLKIDIFGLLLLIWRDWHWWKIVWRIFEFLMLLLAEALHGDVGFRKVL
jgi:hypothetical protein